MKNPSIIVELNTKERLGWISTVHVKNLQVKDLMHLNEEC